MSEASISNSLSIDLRIADPRWEVLGDVDALAAHVLGRAASHVGHLVRDGITKARHAARLHRWARDRYDGLRGLGSRAREV